MGGYAWVTLATNDAYSLGALVLAHSLRQVGTKYDLACLVTPGVTATMREKLAAVFSVVQEVNVLDSKDEANLALLARPELGITFTKLHCWRLTQYEKCVFVDADALVVRNCDELFEREELSAAPDVGWPDCFNSGVFVFRPSQQTFASITAFAAAKGSFDGGDQGLLNMYFSDWASKDISKHLPFIYNMCSTATYSYLPAFKQFGEDVRIIHFIGITKPWLQYFDTLTGIVQPPSGVGHLQPLLQLWWNIFCERVHPQLSISMTGLAGALAQLTLGEARSAEQLALEEHVRKQSWEQGHIDYMGRDSFDNIWKKICETLSVAPQREPTPPQEDVPEAAAKAADEPAETATPVEADKPAVEADKDPTQSLVCKVPDETLSVAQSSEGKAPASLSEENATVETAATKEPAQPAAAEDACAKLTTDPKDVIPCETSTEVPLPKPPVESPPVEPPSVKTIEQCQLSSVQTTQEASSQGESLLLATKEPQQADSQTSACLLCKKEDTSVTRTDSASAPTEAKSETPTSTTRDTTQPTTAAPISADSPQSVVVPPVTSQASVEDAAKRATDVTQPLTIDPSERHAEILLAASEVSTVSPVPIQVAESVLQAEPKESVSGATVSVSDQAISTTVTAVHESTDVAAATTAERVQLNGSVCEAERAGDVAAVVAAVSSLPEKTDAPAEPTKEPPSESATTRDAPSETLSAAEKKVESSNSALPPETPSAEVEKLTESAKTETKPPEQIAKTEAAEVEPPEQLAKAEASGEKAAEAETTEAVAEQPETAEDASSKASDSPVAEQSPPKEEPTEAKILNIPSTPTVIEATPPTSPSAESAQETEEKVAKKSLKKSDSADGADGEGADKKATKKTVKKVVKKPKAKPEEAASSPTSADGAVADGSQSKTKKTVKVVKKTATKTLETDTSVPETPPPPSSASADAPVPPKRKTKSSTASAKGTTAKKPETEE
ncbi:neurofilament heavy polypeptide isoform X2 [Linepithema humile]|uniref:neurofilament heavy polypeptide isoform X2 n=1 Tax=Linepithema humile TaxID=83485 RepID=UPI000623B2AA|nr:PREDICTED: mucin-5AC isoform X2 [Linepithema humile]